MLEIWCPARHLKADGQKHSKMLLVHCLDIDSGAKTAEEYAVKQKIRKLSTFLFIGARSHFKNVNGFSVETIEIFNGFFALKGFSTVIFFQPPVKKIKNGARGARGRPLADWHDHGPAQREKNEGWGL